MLFRRIKPIISSASSNNPINKLVMRQRIGLSMIVFNIRAAYLSLYAENTMYFSSVLLSKPARCR